MLPIDILAENQRDTRPDYQSSKSLFQDSLGVISLGASMRMPSDRELRQLEEDLFRDQGSERDQMAFASMLFGSPLMLLGMGCGFAIADDARLNRISKFETALQNRVQIQRIDGAANAENARLQARNLAGAMEPISRQKADRIFDNLGEKKTKTLLSAVGSDTVTPRSEHPVRRTREVQKPPADPIKMKKLLKEKEQLTQYLEKMRGKLSLRSASNLMARIEQVDKALKKIAS